VGDLASPFIRWYLYLIKLVLYSSYYTSALVLLSMNRIEYEEHDDSGGISSLDTSGATHDEEVVSQTTSDCNHPA